MRTQKNEKKKCAGYFSFFWEHLHVSSPWWMTFTVSVNPAPRLWTSPAKYFTEQLLWSIPSTFYPAVCAFRLFKKITLLFVQLGSYFQISYLQKLQKYSPMLSTMSSMILFHIMSLIHLGFTFICCEAGIQLFVWIASYFPQIHLGTFCNFPSDCEVALILKQILIYNIYGLCSIIFFFLNFVPLNFLSLTVFRIIAFNYPYYLPYFPALV